MLKPEAKLLFRQGKGLNVLIIFSLTVSPNFLERAALQRLISEGHITVDGKSGQAES